MPDSRIHIRKAGLNDLDAIVKIEKQSFNEEAFSRGQLRYLITKIHGASFVVTVDKTVAGYISLFWRQGYRNLRIYSIAVAPGYRGLHLGQLLMDTCFDYARTLHLTYVSLEVETENTAAIGLYKKNGFMGIGILKNYYAPDKDGFKMICNLTNVKK